MWTVLVPMALGRRHWLNGTPVNFRAHRLSTGRGVGRQLMRPAGREMPQRLALDTERFRPLTRDNSLFQSSGFENVRVEI